MPVPAGNPRPTEDALRWQLERVGSTAWEGFGLKFQRMAFGFAVETGVADECEALRWLLARDGIGAGEPPRGKLAWYEASGGVSVLSSLGDGKVVGAGVNGAIGVMHYLDRPGYAGWSEPIFPYAS
ncbi:MAG TPA: hypothetical protein VF062_28255 [Candidatus Limnocylindrales bacterium]